MGQNQNIHYWTLERFSFRFSFYEIVSGNVGTNAGTYTVTVAAIEDGGYTGTVSKEWEIGKASAVITAEDKAACVDNGVPTLTYKVEGLIAGDALTAEPALACDADMTIAGTYSITAMDADANGNYTFAYVDGTLTVNEHVYDNDTDATCNNCDAVRHICQGDHVEGQQATCIVDGWKDYYRCSCEKSYADANCTIEITDLDAWKIGEGKIASGHVYGEPVFIWSEDLHSAVCTITCGNCAEGTEGHAVPKSCEVTFDFADGVMNITAEVDEMTAVLTFSIASGKLELPEEFPANGIIVAVSYNDDGQMIDVQFLKEGETLAVSGNVKVYFLNANYEPILPSIEN